MLLRRHVLPFNPKNILISGRYRFEIIFKNDKHGFFPLLFIGSYINILLGGGELILETDREYVDMCTDFYM